MHNRCFACGESKRTQATQEANKVVIINSLPADYHDAMGSECRFQTVRVCSFRAHALNVGPDTNRLNTKRPKRCKFKFSFGHSCNEKKPKSPSIISGYKSADLLKIKRVDHFQGGRKIMICGILTGKSNASQARSVRGLNTVFVIFNGHALPCG